ncbi:MAG: hypothetical protein NTW79_02865 [Candidatus Berkelbacteria bacterium]|nr:hypothetical protein [Candidatus Berkelbacteria bacterium]
MRSYKPLILVGIVLVATTAGYFVWNNSYSNEVFRQWNNLQTSLTELNSFIDGNHDFCDIVAKVSMIKTAVDQRKSYFERKSVPFGRGDFNRTFVNYLENVSACLGLISDNCNKWDGKMLTDLNQKTQALHKSQNDCANSIHYLSKKDDIFMQIPTILNQMHEKRSAPTPKHIVEIVSTTSPVLVDQQAFGFRSSAVEEMRMIMREYLRDRDYFNATAGSILSDLNVFGERCIADRYVLIHRLENLDLPNEYYRETGQLFVSGINDAIEAIRIKCRTGDGHSEAARRAADKICQVQKRL